MDGTWADDSTVHIVAIRQAASFPECFIGLFAPAGIEIRAGEAHGTNVQTYTASLAAIRTGWGRQPDSGEPNRAQVGCGVRSTSWLLGFGFHWSAVGFVPETIRRQWKNAVFRASPRCFQ